MFSGSFVALVTPFREDAIDVEAFQRLIEWQIAEGTEGLVVCGSTGEGFSLTREEHARVIDVTVKTVRKRVPVIAGASSMTTSGAIDLAHQAENLGADGLLIVTPPYVKPTQDGIYEHFRAVAAAIELPIIVYNHPGRTGTMIEDQTMIRLAALETIVGVKDSTDLLSRPLALRQVLGPDFVQLSGDDGTALAFLAQGGHGCISTIGNLVPGLCARLHLLWKEGKKEEALDLQTELYSLYRLAFSEASPAPVKDGLSYMGLCQADIRSPLQPFSPGGQKALRQKLLEMGALDSIASFLENNPILGLGDTSLPSTPEALSQ